MNETTTRAATRFREPGRCALVIARYELARRLAVASTLTGNCLRIADMPGNAPAVEGDASTTSEAERIPTTRELQVGAVAAMAPTVAVSGLLLCLALIAALSSTVPLWMLVIWGGVMIPVAWATPLYLQRVKGRTLADGEARRAFHVIVVLSAVRALAWGVGAAIFYRYASPPQVTLLCVLVVGTALGSGSSLASIPIASATFGLCTITPLAAVLIASGDPLNIAIAALLLTLGLAVASGARQVFKYVQTEAGLRGALLDKQKELVRAQHEATRANHAKSDFLAGMSHELRTPLNSILGYSDLMLQKTHGPVAPERYAEYVGYIHDSGAHLLQLINDVLDLAKIEAGKREMVLDRVSLRETADEAIRLVSPQSERALVSVMSNIERDVVVHTDARAVKQIITNLLSNAVKFSRAGGIAVVFCNVLADGRVCFGVRDTGIGMDPETLHKVIEPFAQGANVETVEGHGTGLGLPIVKGLIEALGGRLRIESTLGKGSKIWVEFPQAVSAAAAA